MTFVHSVRRFIARLIWNEPTIYCVAPEIDIEKYNEQCVKSNRLARKCEFLENRINDFKQEIAVLQNAHPRLTLERAMKLIELETAAYRTLAIQAEDNFRAEQYLRKYDA